MQLHEEQTLLKHFAGRHIGKKEVDDCGPPIFPPKAYNPGGHGEELYHVTGKITFLIQTTF